MAGARLQVLATSLLDTGLRKVKVTSTFDSGGLLINHNDIEDMIEVSNLFEYLPPADSLRLHPEPEFAALETTYVLLRRKLVLFLFQSLESLSSPKPSSIFLLRSIVRRDIHVVLASFFSI
jgi:hypothetical protein